MQEILNLIQPLQAESFSAPRVTPTNDKVETYSREFLVGYLLHYCRLSHKMRKQNTIPVLQALLEIEPENGEVYFLLGRQYQMAGKLAEALACFEKAAVLRPDKPGYVLAGVHTACLLGQRTKALSMVCNVISAYPNMAEAYYERGLIFEADTNWARAARDYEMCIRFDPENPAYLCAAAAMYRRQSLYKIARRLANKALKIDPNYSLAHEELRLLPFFEQFGLVSSSKDVSAIAN
jgi:tetratricopeptide (TPR) repeat protein